MSDPTILPPSPTPPEPPAPSPEPRGARNIRCGFCDAALTPAGEVLKLSDRAKALRDFEDDLGDANRDLAEARTALDAANTKIGGLERENAALKAEKKKGFWS